MKSKKPKRNRNDSKEKFGGLFASARSLYKKSRKTLRRQ